MSTGFFKRNERVVMTLLLILIAPTFAATGLISWWAGNAAAVASYEINGETVSSETFLETRRQLSKSLWLQNVRRFGWWAARTDRYRQATQDDVLKRLVFEAEISRLGIEPSDEVKNVAIRDAVLDVTTWYRVMEQSGWTGTYQERLPDFNSLRPTARFDLETYRAALSDQRFQIRMSIKEFEETIIQSLRVQELINLVVDAAVVTEKEIFDEFSNINQRRALDLIQVTQEPFLTEARELVTPDDIEQVYNDNPQQFVLQNRLSVEVARINRALLQQQVEYEPTAEEIEASYEADKDTIWRIRRPDGYVPPEGATPEDDYRPLVDVFDAVVRNVTREHAKTVEAKLLQDALDTLKAMKEDNQAVPMEQAFPEELDYVEVHTLSPFVQREVGQLENEFKNPAAYATIFMQERATPGSVQPGDLYDAIANNSQGNFIFRVVEMLPQRTMTYDEAIEDALKVAEENQAKTLMATSVEELLAPVKAGEQTLEDVAQDQNYSIQSLDPVSRTESYNLRIDNRQILARNEVMTEAFALDDVGAVAGPILSDLDKSGYIVRLKSIEDPDMELFDSLRGSTELRLLRAKQQALLDSYESDLMRSAQIRVFQDEGPPVPRDELLEGAEENPEAAAR